MEKYSINLHPSLKRQITIQNSKAVKTQKGEMFKMVTKVLLLELLTKFRAAVQV